MCLGCPVYATAVGTIQYVLQSHCDKFIDATALLHTTTFPCKHTQSQCSDEVMGVSVLDCSENQCINGLRLKSVLNSCIASYSVSLDVSTCKAQGIRICSRPYSVLECWHLLRLHIALLVHVHEYSCIETCRTAGTQEVMGDSHGAHRSHRCFRVETCSAVGIQLVCLSGPRSYNSCIHTCHCFSEEDRS